jgi:chloramphenicol-sensitive protein RarD
MLQYLTPTLQFLIGVVLYGEPMTPARWVGFSLVWLALVVFTGATLRHRRRQLRTAAEAAAV